MNEASEIENSKHHSTKQDGGSRIAEDRGRSLWMRRCPLTAGIALAPAVTATAAAIAGPGQSLKAAAAALWVRTRKSDGPSRARCDGDRGCFAQRPQRHCELAPGGWTDRNGDEHDQGRHGTFSAAPRERLPPAQLGCTGPWHQTLTAQSPFDQAELAGRGDRGGWLAGTGWDWLAGYN